MELERFRHMLENYLNIKFNKNPSSGSRDIPSGQTDSHDELIVFFAVLRTLQQK